MNFKINNRILISLFIILIVIVGVWLIGYFTGIDKNGDEMVNDLTQQGTVVENGDNNQENSLPPLPGLPPNSTKSEKSAQNNKLPPLPGLPPNFTDRIL